MNETLRTLEPNAAGQGGVGEVPAAPVDSLPDRVVELLSRLFSALADPSRLRILCALSQREELCVCDLAEMSGISVSAASHQLRLLRDRDLVGARRDGRMVYYRLADDHVGELLRCGTEHALEA
jgi:DNA-binding transcriptional ArsR family regulator